VGRWLCEPKSEKNSDWERED